MESENRVMELAAVIYAMEEEEIKRAGIRQQFQYAGAQIRQMKWGIIPILRDYIGTRQVWKLQKTA